jgi:nucleotidyltransferase/DNA polymerase involved in DNA repair
MGTPALVGHLDSDCFYVSCERVRSPCLHRLPVAVLGNQGACVIAKSYEMKAKGVKTGEPVWEAVRKCPEAVYVKRDFRWYEVISRQILHTLRAVSPAVEYHSIDEMFFDATALPRAFDASLPHAVEALQKRVLREARVPASIGVSLSKTLAKLASDAAKPFGVRVLLDRGDIEKFLAGRPVEEVAGIGERSRRKLARHGILTCLDFAQANRHFVRKLLTIRGEALWWELNGTPVSPILTERPAHKCFSRGGSLGEATADPERLTAWAVRNVERLVEELDHYHTFTARLTLALSFKGGGGWSGRTALPETTARFDLLVTAAKHLLAKACRLKRRVCRIHVLADRLSRRPVQGSLFPCPNPAAERVAFVKKFVNERVGRFAVRSGDTLPLADIYRDEATGYDICDVRGKFCF